MLSLTLPAGDLEVLCLGAHPDDIEIGCGGTLLRLAAARRVVRSTALILTGSGRRIDEAWAASPRFLPGCQVRLAGLADGRVPAQWGRAKQALEELATECRPDLIFAPRSDDAHQDHRLLAGLVPTVWRDALTLHYEIPKWDGDLGKVDHYVPLSVDLARQKVALLDECFPSQKSRDWWDDELFLGLMRMRGMGCRHRYAEGFLITKSVLEI